MKIQSNLANGVQDLKLLEHPNGKIPYLVMNVLTEPASVAIWMYFLMKLKYQKSHCEKTKLSSTVDTDFFPRT